MVCVRHTAVMQPREFAEMVEEGIREAAAMAEWLELLVQRLSLGVEVEAFPPWSRLIFEDLTRWKQAFERELNLKKLTRRL